MVGSGRRCPERRAVWRRVRAGEVTGGLCHRDAGPPAGARLPIAGERGKGAALGCQPVRSVSGVLALRDRHDMTDVRAPVTCAAAGGP